jgi:hypothetical protein
VVVGGCIRDNRGVKRVLGPDSAMVVVFAAVGEAAAAEYAAAVAASARI